MNFFGIQVHLQVPSYIFLFYCRTMQRQGGGGVPGRKDGTSANGRHLSESSASPAPIPPCSSARPRPAGPPPSSTERCSTWYGVSATSKPWLRRRSSTPLCVVARSWAMDARWLDLLHKDKGTGLKCDDTADADVALCRPPV